MRIEMMIKGSESIPEIRIDGTRLDVVKFAKFYGGPETMFSFDANYPQKENLGSSPFPFTGLSFGIAIDMVKKGHKIQREGWNGKGQYVELASNISYTNAAGDTVNAQHAAIGNAALAFVGTSGVQLGWLASQADMLADDWRIVE